MWVDSSAVSQTGFKIMPDADLNAAIDRYLSTIFTNNYPGTYQLGSSSPGGTYSVHLANAFTDTRTDGTSVQYNIYKKTSGSAPTAVRPLFVEDSANGSGIKLREMNDRQIQYSFGQRAKTRSAAAGSIGSYQLRSSAQGAPTDPGTWVAKGTAVDTKQTTSQQVFTRDSTVNFQANYTKAYTSNYATNYTKLIILICMREPLLETLQNHLLFRIQKLTRKLMKKLILQHMLVHILDGTQVHILTTLLLIMLAIQM